MRILKISCIGLFLLLFSISSADDHGQLAGAWIVDLRPTPDADPYLKAMQIDEVEGNHFTGSFYGTPFTDGVINSDWGTVQFAFTTEDGRTSYHHTGELNGDQIIGRTHAPGRQMLSIWRAER